MRYTLSLTHTSFDKETSLIDRPVHTHNQYHIRFGGLLILKAVLAAQMLKHKKESRHLIQPLVQLLPPALRHIAETSLLKSKFTLPNWSTRNQLIVDVALMLYRRKHCIFKDCMCYVMADSSSQQSGNYMITRSRVVSSADSILAAEAMDRLWFDARKGLMGEGDWTLAEVDCPQAVADEDMEPDQGPAHHLDNSFVIEAADSSDEASAESDSSDIDRAVFYAVLVTTMLNIMHPPMNLGMGRVSAEDKAAAMLFSFCLEVARRMIVAFLDSVVAFTSDFGTEKGLSNFSGGRLSNLLPSWVCDCLTEDGDDEALFMPQSFFFNSVMPVGGVLHIFSNACKDVNKAMHLKQNIQKHNYKNNNKNEAMQLFSRFFDSMKVLEKLVSDRQRMKRFAATCIPVRHNADKMLRRIIHPMYDKRWVEVANFCMPVLELWDQISHYWDSNKFGMDSAEAGTAKEFKPTAISEVLQNGFNYVYCLLVTLLNGLYLELIAWAEFCPCHRHLQENTKDNSQLPFLMRSLAVTDLDTIRACPVLHGVA